MFQKVCYVIDKLDQCKPYERRPKELCMRVFMRVLVFVCAFESLEDEIRMFPEERHDHFSKFLLPLKYKVLFFQKGHDYVKNVGLTLVELLVVITIIALLVTHLAIVLSKEALARYMAKKKDFFWCVLPNMYSLKKNKWLRENAMNSKLVRPLVSPNRELMLACPRHPALSAMSIVNHRRAIWTGTSRFTRKRGVKIWNHKVIRKKAA